jgi:hypothetical protein
LPILPLRLRRGSTLESRDVHVQRLIIAGWTGRDRAAVEKHIRELEELGVKPPTSVPMFYRASAARLTTSPEIEVVGADSSGEVEFVLLKADGGLWVGVGSDHTDRKVETYNVTVSKQMCEKPVAAEFWFFDEVAGHWDELVLRSSIEENGARVVYQEGRVSSMLPPGDLISLAAGAAGLAEGTAMFCGTLAARGGIRPAAGFDFELFDPVRQRRIEHGYAIHSLPNVG